MNPPDIEIATALHAVKPTGIRWRVLAWLCSLSAITYIGRVSIVQSRAAIELDLGLSPALTAYAFSAFSLAYAWFEVPSGWLGDRLGPRRVLSRIVLCWLVFNALTGAVCWIFVDPTRVIVYSDADRRR